MPEHYGEQIRKSGDELNAATIVEIWNDDGIAGVARELGCTARQAQEVAARAGRAVREGRDLKPNEIPTNAVAAAKSRRPPKIGRAFTDAEVREMAEKVAPAALVGLTAEEYRDYQARQQEEERRARNDAINPAYNKPVPIPGFESHEDRQRRLRERASR
jgi:hypothetical protein